MKSFTKIKYLKNFFIYIFVSVIFANNIYAASMGGSPAKSAPYKPSKAIEFDYKEDNVVHKNIDITDLCVKKYYEDNKEDPNAQLMLESVVRQRIGRYYVDMINGIKQTYQNTKGIEAENNPFIFNQTNAKWKLNQFTGKWQLLNTTLRSYCRNVWQRYSDMEGNVGYYKFDDNANMQTGFVVSRNTLYYLSEDEETLGKLLKNATLTIGNARFEIAVDGAIVSITEDDNANMLSQVIPIIK